MLILVHFQQPCASGAQVWQTQTAWEQPAGGARAANRTLFALMLQPDSQGLRPEICCDVWQFFLCVTQSPNVLTLLSVALVSVQQPHWNHRETSLYGSFCRSHIQMVSYLPSRVLFCNLPLLTWVKNKCWNHMSWINLRPLNDLIRGKICLLMVQQERWTLAALCPVGAEGLKAF